MLRARDQLVALERARWLADLALRFGPPEYFALMLGGLLLLSRLSGGSLVYAFVMVAFSSLFTLYHQTKW